MIELHSGCLASDSPPGSNLCCKQSLVKADTASEFTYDRGLMQKCSSSFSEALLLLMG